MIEAILYDNVLFRIPHNDKYIGLKENSRLFIKHEDTKLLIIDGYSVGSIKKLSRLEIEYWIESTSVTLEVMLDALKDFIITNPGEHNRIFKIYDKRKEKLFKVYKWYKRRNPLYKVKYIENVYSLELRLEFKNDCLTVDKLMFMSFESLLDYRNYIRLQIRDKKLSMNMALNGIAKENDTNFIRAYRESLQNTYKSLKSLLIHYNLVMNIINSSRKH